MGFSMHEIRDLDLMMKLQEQGASGATSKELAEELGQPDSRGNVGTRLGWMRHYGMVEFDTKRRLWTLSPGGGRVVEAKVKSALERELLEMPDAQFIEVMSHVTTRYRLGDPMTAAMLRREFVYGTSPRTR